MSENIYRLTKTEINKLNKLLEAALDHVNEDGVVITEEEADNRKRSKRPVFGLYLNGCDDAKVTEEIRKWSGHDRIHIDHVANQRRALFGSNWHPKEKKKYYTPAIALVEEFKQEVELRFEAFEKRVKQLEFDAGRQKLAGEWNVKR